MNNINFFDSELIIRLTPLTNETINIAEDILSKNVKIFHSLSNVKVEKLEHLWEVDLPTAPSTYALYIYAMYPISYLLNAFEKTNNKKYLHEALVVSKSFVDWQEKDDKKISNKRKKVLFGDHSTSNRTQVFCYLLTCLISADIKLEKWLIKTLIENGIYLSSHDNYSHYNHGLMMDLALLGLINTLNGANIPYPESFKINLIERLSYSLIRDLTKDGIHVENSPGYHFWMLGFLKRIEKSLMYLDDDLYSMASSLLNRATKYAKYVTRPDGTIPAIGDTALNLKYTPSEGLVSKFFTDSNIVIFRNRENSVWAYLSSGYKTHVHKHADDGSFNLFYKENDIFIDPGFLNYENNEQGLLIKKAAFHNTVKPINEEIEIFKKNLTLDENKKGYNENLTESKVLGFYSDEKYEASIAIISGYTCGDIERLVIFDRKGSFVIHDRVIKEADLEYTFEQRFNISPKVVFEVNNKNICIRNNLGGDLCEIQQFLPINISPKDSYIRVEKAFYAESFNKAKDCNRLVFTFQGVESLIFIKLCDYGDQPYGKIDSEYLYGLSELLRCKIKE